MVSDTPREAAAAVAAVTAEAEQSREALSLTSILNVQARIVKQMTEASSERDKPCYST